MTNSAQDNRQESNKPVAAEKLHLDDFPAGYEHVPSLDGMRAISILLVLVAHIVSRRLAPGGLGVLIFFVISGFLITRLLIAEFKKSGTNRLSNFYLRRIFRLYPAVVIYSLIVSAGILIFTPDSFDIMKPVSALFYFANYLETIRGTTGSQTSTPFGIFWSLSVEEQYYAIFPILFIWARAIPRRLVILAAAGCMFPLVLRFVYVTLWPQILSGTGSIIYSHTETRIDSIAFGVLIAAACETMRGRRVVRFLIEPLPVILAILVIAGCIVFLLCAVVFSERYKPANLLLNSRLFVWIGQLSYSIYVWHMALVKSMHHILFTWPVAARTLVTFALVLLVASASYYGPEAAARKYRDKFHLR